MLQTRPILAEDVTKIFNKPWYATAEDIVANDFDLLSKQELLDKIIKEYAKYYGVALFDDASPSKILAIMGIHPQDGEENIWWTWFFAAHDFQERWREITAFTKEIMERHVIIEGIKQMRAYSPAGNKPEGIYWFKKLGFHKAENFVITMNNGYNLYMFQRFFK